MKLLLDTQTLLWWLAADSRLSVTHRELVADPTNDILISSMSVAEIAITASTRRLRIPGELRTVTESGGFESLPFTAAHGDALRYLPWHHRDPFARMLIAQASVEGVPMLTADSRVREYDIAVL